MNAEESNKPEIIIDDDWKSRAQAEKEQLQKEAEAKRKQQPTADAPDEPTADAPDEPTAVAPDEPAPVQPEPEPDVPFPPASFSFLVTSLATQALAAMGQLPSPDSKQAVQLDYAKHFIDTLGILEEKTKGNLAADEMVMLSNVLHELRMLFVEAGKQAAADSQES